MDLINFLHVEMPDLGVFLWKDQPDSLVVGLVNFLHMEMPDLGVFLWKD